MIILQLSDVMPGGLRAKRAPIAFDSFADIFGWLDFVADRIGRWPLAKYGIAGDGLTNGRSRLASLVGVDAIYRRLLWPRFSCLKRLGGREYKHSRFY